ncbi:transposase [Xanthomonas sp. XNM01]|uniref:REP-associated tyrosine transposase n=1 Tax=Xanthomonas sp. XNM01 TaxID=2769289 RepID=UPI001CE11304|nr:transposase [Xanthomonas sp. XNM01]
MDMHTSQRFDSLSRRRGARRVVPGEVHHLIVGTLGQAAWFSDFHVGCVAVRAFREPALLGDAELLAWVLMPDHCHWLLRAGRQMPVEKAASRMKSASAAQVNRVLSRAGALWEPAFRDRALGAEENVRDVARAIVANPLRAGLSDRLGDYPFWDCIWL